MQFIRNKLGIIIPAYNEEKNIGKILESLEHQSICDFEVIVVDDGSSDETATIVKNYKSKRYSLTLLQQENKGAALARLAAIEKSTSTFIAVLDCDDSIAFDTLEKALIPILKNNDIDISLFKLHYVNSICDEKSVVFNYYTTKKLLDGIDVFENCIKHWGVHGFGIYRKELILKAYKIYNEINELNQNFLNNDEVISRISFDISNKIAITDGSYYFVNNPESTTRRINFNYFKIINNAFILLDYIKEKREKGEFSDVSNNINSLIISTIWGVTIRYIKWNKHLSRDERLQWRLAINQSLNQVKKLKLNRTLKESFKLLVINSLIKK
ncbi:glycosyltransferase family 2 protein [Providencia rettgeri]|uniref:glycosyltransferase family 2 protein n=1 Tax=Providencia rettgeri TaxID=587 RepID=UPI0015EC004A|nr:glycosyltransferase family 2 protein [Providencia rettgeri]QLR04781.1 glycosyltransferase family 2 protein [Providencia rettgeri]